jgi:hypothetical protein
VLESLDTKLPDVSSDKREETVASAPDAGPKRGRSLVSEDRSSRTNDKVEVLETGVRRLSHILYRGDCTIRFIDRLLQQTRLVFLSQIPHVLLCTTYEGGN